MILFEEKKECCGCNACVSICSKRCILLEEDKEGFSYPKIDHTQCINCGRCNLVCPVINQGEPRKPMKVYAAKNKNEQIRKESSSGGIFTLMAEQIIKENGCVFGARFDNNWDVIHDCSDTITGLAAFRGSKYVQSNIGHTYHECKKYLKQGRKVLYSGTPCQIAGLSRFLNKDYNNLLKVDFVCHGVPSPKVWQLYKQELLAKYNNNNLKNNVSEFSYISFRDKIKSWKKFSFNASIRQSNENDILFVETFDNNIFMKGFLKDLYLRPSCYECPAKNLKSGSDITLADFWGIENIFPEFDDDKGVSLLLINTLKGELQLKKLDPKIQLKSSSYKLALNGNPSLEKSVLQHRNRNKFFKDLEKKQISEWIEQNIKPSIKENIFSTIRKILI